MISDPEKDSICLETIKNQCFEVTQALLEVGKLKPGQIIVLGCSTSEVRGRVYRLCRQQGDRPSLSWMVSEKPLKEPV